MIAFSISAPRATWSHSAARRLLTAMLLVTGTTTTYADNTIYVTTTEQEINDNGECSLQEAIYSANFDNNIAVVATNPDQFVTTACVAGNGHDRIVLPAGRTWPNNSATLVTRVSGK